MIVVKEAPVRQIEPNRRIPAAFPATPNRGTEPTSAVAETMYYDPNNRIPAGEYSVKRGKSVLG